MKAKRIAAGDALALRGQRWEVIAVRRDKAAGTVRLLLDSNGERFDGTVPEARAFERWIAPQFDATGAQGRWATPAEADAVSRKLSADVPVHTDDGAMPPLEPWEPNTDAERAVASIMGGTILGVQRLPDGAWLVPPVDSSTVFAHLLTFHDTEAPSASLNDVRTPLAEQTETAAEALLKADVAGALALHTAQHADGLPSTATPHRHA